MQTGTIVQRVKDSQKGIIIATRGNKIRVKSLSDPNCIWRLQLDRNYTISDSEASNDPISKEPIKTKLQNTVEKSVILKSFDRSQTCTRKQYREKIKSIGLEISSDSDVLHIISKANGGADHVDNYFFLGNMRLNRKLGNRADEIYCYLCGLEGTKRAVAASVKFGTFSDHYISPEKLYEKGLERFSVLFE